MTGKISSDSMHTYNFMPIRRKGILFRKLDKRIEAMDCFLRSLELLPYNWSAWQELSTTLVGGRAEVRHCTR